MSNETGEHYFAATGYAWAVGESREKAIARVARDAGKRLIARHKNGLYCVTYRVPLPIDAPYEISEYRPVGVGACDMREHRITNAKGAHTPDTI